LDNDSDLDVVTVFGPADCRVIHCDGLKNPTKQPNTVHIQQDGGFVLAQTEWKLDSESDGRGLAMADLNMDGYLDVIQRHHEEAPLVRLSRCGANRWLRVELRDEGPNTHGIGARITAVTGEKRQHRWLVAGGTGLAGSGPSWVQFGLDQAERIDRLEVLWPDGSLWSAEDLAPNQILRINRRR
jgi:hypothetical protein